MLHQVYCFTELSAVHCHCVHAWPSQHCSATVLMWQLSTDYCWSDTHWCLLTRNHLLQSSTPGLTVQRHSMTSSNHWYRIHKNSAETWKILQQTTDSVECRSAWHSMTGGISWVLVMSHSYYVQPLTHEPKPKTRVWCHSTPKPGIEKRAPGLETLVCMSKFHSILAEYQSLQLKHIAFNLRKYVVCSVYDLQDWQQQQHVIHL